MTEVQISHIDRRRRVVIGGVDLTNAITPDGIRVDLLSSPDYPLVHVTFRARELSLDIDDAVIEAERQLIEGTVAK